MNIERSGCIWRLSQDVLQFRGYIKLNKFQKSEKNSEMGGWVKPQVGFSFFFGNVLFLCVFFVILLFVVHVSKKNIKKWVGEFFSDFWNFFNLTKPFSVISKFASSMLVHHIITICNSSMLIQHNVITRCASAMLVHLL